jgi:hypothetical protein
MKTSTKYYLNFTIHTQNYHVFLYHHQYQCNRVHKDYHLVRHILQIQYQFDHYINID